MLISMHLKHGLYGVFLALINDSVSLITTEAFMIASLNV